MYNIHPSQLIEKTAKKLKPIIKIPEWSKFVKTGSSKERIPDKEWWHLRAASILRQVSLKGPIGTSKLRTKYGSKKNRGVKPEKFYRGSGKIIRTILQQLEKVELITSKTKTKKKGRSITPKGRSLLDKK